MVSEWNRVKLEEIAEITGGGTPTRSNEDYWNGDIPWLTPTDVTRNNKNHLSETENYITAVGLRNSSAKLIPENNVLMTSRATIGKSIINKIPMTTNQGFANFICNREKVRSEYLLYLLNSKAKKFEQLGSGSTFKEISKGELKSFVVDLPPIIEQQKIAAILSSVDEAIEKTEQIIEQTEKVRKGLMQQLLTKGVGHKNFKKTLIGNIPDSWELKRFKDICRIVNGQVDPKQMPYSHMPHIGNANIEKFTGEVLSYKTAKQEGQTSGKYLFDHKHVLYGKINPHFGKVAYPGFNGICSADVYPIEPSEGILPMYLKEVLLSHRFISYTTSVSGRTGIPKVNRKDLDPFLIPVPPLDEQKKIIDIIGNVEERLKNENLKQDKLKEIKQGLMQQLLTGKVRVPIDNEEVVET
ncbi:type I restriction enzyme, S subunit [Lentibacillus persicus]|uniref:Type I restriction enzyme, S subunit n=1 Tax=Lentibacillus persicus TaxID=640948 RepID=A0A1I1XB37_9BACI|nr:restriction endonuclease subunit S [Lentibacillus persicus]SFE02580.1 type I restriction enzyme, S subunit [Lentibacillus persicus]